MADSDDDELFQFAKPTRVDENHDHLLKDFDCEEEENDQGGIVNRNRKRPLSSPIMGLAEQLIAGKAKKRHKGSNQDEVELLFKESQNTDNDDTADDTTKAHSNDDTSSEDDDSLLINDSWENERYYDVSCYSNKASFADYQKGAQLMDSIEATLHSLNHSSSGSRHHRIEYVGDDETDGLESEGNSPLLTMHHHSSAQLYTLRVRCKGTVHSFQLSKWEPLSVVVESLSDKYKVHDMLMQFKGKDVKHSDTVTSLALSTVDILDAFPLDKATVKESNPVINKDNDIMNIKIQSSRKTLSYSVRNNEPFERIMKEFASEVDVRLSKIKFTFDGSMVSGRSTTLDHEMEDGDIIDAVIPN